MQASDGSEKCNQRNKRAEVSGQNSEQRHAYVLGLLIHLPMKDDPAVSERQLQGERCSKTRASACQLLVMG